MAASSKRGVLVLSLDLPVVADPRTEKAVKSILQQFEQRHIPATWASHDPSASPAAGLLSACHARHELALLIDGAPSLATEINQHLGRQLLRAKAAGLTIHSLALTQPCPTNLWQTAQRHGIRWVRSAASQPAAKSPVVQHMVRRLVLRSQPIRLCSPRVIPFGLVDIPAALRFSSARDIARVRVALAEAATTGGLLHVVLESSLVLAAMRGDVRLFAQLLADAADFQARAGLSVITLAEAAARFSRSRTTVRAQSILRRAA